MVHVDRAAAAAPRSSRRPSDTRARRLPALLAGLFTACLLAAADCDRFVKSVRVGGTFNAPIFLTAPAGDSRLFVVERAGLVRVVQANGTVLAQPFLDVRSQVSTSGESGLLGLAFSPEFSNDREVYAYFINLAGDSVLARFQVLAGDPNRVAPASQTTILVVDQPAATNHKGGTIAFSPVDGNLYWALGDGGSSSLTAQNPQTLLGKMLRIDVTGTQPTYLVPGDNPFVGPGGALDEIWSLGFRNPFRFGFDRATGDLWIGDVGQGMREEVDHEPADDPGGLNYGWSVHEGTRCHQPQPNLPCENPQNPVRFTFPVHEYTTHVNGTCAITGGVVYRGSNSFLQGLYLFADYCANRIWGIAPNGSVRDLTQLLAPTSGTIDGIVAFGEDGFGQVYLVSLNSGQIHRIE
jgi:glucose/arabinose dehydrogenase